jgi:hypothetical protein
MIINNKTFNTLKPFIQAIIDRCGDSLPDYMFSKACEEFNISEEEAMERMMNSRDYTFIRLAEGWNIEFNIGNGV